MIGEYAWTWHVLSLEFRKIFAYRIAFWIQFVVRIFTEIAIAYFLWKAIFSTEHAETIGGYSFHGIIFYSLFAVFCSRIIQEPSNGEISNEIYQGSLTRYLFYPLSFFLYKLVCCLAYQLLALAQLAVCIILAILIWKSPSDQSITFSSVLLGSFTSLIAGYVYFSLGSCLEQVAFWQDAVWNLLVMLKFIGGLLGGLLIPLSLFPTWGRNLAMITPFPYIYSFPIRCFLGQVNSQEWLKSAAILVFWGTLSTVLSRAIWKIGLKNYAGVGI